MKNILLQLSDYNFDNPSTVSFMIFGIIIITILTIKFIIMNKQKQHTDNTAGSIRLIGSLVLISGIVLLIMSQLIEVSVTANSENVNVETLIELPKKIADKTNFTLLGGFLIIIGLQLSLVSNKIISEIKEQFKKPI